MSAADVVAGLDPPGYRRRVVGVIAPWRATRCGCDQGDAETPRPNTS